MRELGDEVGALFTQVLMTCDRLGLIGKELFAIDGVRLPSNASKERSGTYAELLHRADRLEKAADRIIETHRSRDEGKGEDDLDAKRRAQLERIRREARARREFVATHPAKRNTKGTELKSNVTDDDSAKTATGNGVIQGYAAQAAVDAKHRVIVAAELAEGGTEQRFLLALLHHCCRFHWSGCTSRATKDGMTHNMAVNRTRREPTSLWKSFTAARRLLPR